MLFGDADFSVCWVFLSDKFKEHYKCYLEPQNKWGHISIFTDGCIIGTQRLSHICKAALGDTTCTTPFPASNYDFYPGKRHCHFEMELRTRQTKNLPSYNFCLGVHHVLEGLGAVGNMFCIYI